MVYKNLFCLVVGLVIGIRLTDLWDYVRLQKFDNISNTKSDSTISSSCFTTKTAQTSASGSTLESLQQQPPALSDILFNETRVLCWIMTSPDNHFHARNVLSSWGSRCNRLLFMSSDEDANLGTTIKLNVSEGRNYLWQKTREAFKYVYEHYFDEADWFLKADDDTYVIMENLRVFLYQFSSDAPVYFGCKFNRFVRQGYMSGGAGYVLSKEALRRFVEIAYYNGTICSRNQLSEDKEMGVCLENVGVVAGDSRDEEGQERFLPLAPKHLIPVLTSSWYKQYLFYKPTEDTKTRLCCSHSAISFHYIKPKEFYIFDYLLYGLRPFALSSAIDHLPQKVNMTTIIKKWHHQLSNNVP